MRLGRRLTTGVAEHPPAREPAREEVPEPPPVEIIDQEPRVPAELGAER